MTISQVSIKALLLLAVALCGTAGAQTSHRVWTSENGLPQNTVHAILQTRDGFLWVGTEKGMTRFDGSDFLTYTSENSQGFTDDDVRSLSEDKDGSLVLSTPSGGFRLGRGFFSPAKDIHRREPSSLSDMKGFHWSYGGDEIVRRTQTGAPLRWKLSEKGDLNRIQVLLIDSRNIVWVGTRRGLFRIDKDKLTSVSELSGDSILCLLEDREGGIWVGGSTTGLHLLSPRSISIVSAFSSRGITTVAETDNGDLWVGTQDDGLLRLRRNQVMAVTTKQGLPSDFVLSLAAAANGSLLAGSPDGLIRIAEGRPAPVLDLKDSLPDNFIRSILADRDGSIWMGTRHGLVHWDHGKVNVVDHTVGLKSDLVGSLLRTSDGDLWIGTLHGVSRFHGGQFASFEPDDAATSLTEDSQGKIWLGTATKGLYLWDGSGFRNVVSASIPQKIFGLLDDNRGFLWLRTHSGLGRIALSQAAACALENRCDLAVRFFNTSDGLPSNDIFESGHPGQMRSKDGALYFATRRGLATIDPDAIQANKAIPLPSLTRLTVDGRDRRLLGGEEVNIGPQDRRVTFAYVAPSFLQPDGMRYRYRLEGFDKGWVDAGTLRSVSYTNLPAGHHRFAVMAVNEDGLWSTHPAEFVIVVTPPIYRRWWFYLLVVLMSIAFFLFSYWLRERKLKQQFAAVLSERNRIAREIHDTLAQDLAGVSVQLEVVSSLMKAHKIESAEMQLEETKAIVRDGLTNARQSIWDLRATGDDQAFSVRAKLAAEQSAGKQQAVRFEITGVYRPLSRRAEDELISILKEAVRNSAHYSGRESVEVSLQYGAETLVMTVRDDGRGFDPASLSDSGRFGVRGMRERADAIGVTLLIESESGKGTKVTLAAPYR